MGGISSMFGGGKGGGGGGVSVEFKPYDITLPSGTATFDTEKETAQASLSPELKSLLDTYLTAITGAVPTEQELKFAKDVQTMGETQFRRLMDPASEAERAKTLYQDYLTLQKPSRELENLALAERLYQTGRTNLGIGDEGAGYYQPETYALQKARSEADTMANIASRETARTERLADLQSMLGYYGMGQSLKYEPYQYGMGLFNLPSNIYKISEAPLGYGIQIGQAEANAMGAQAAAAAQEGSGRAGMWGQIIGAGIGALF